MRSYRSRTIRICLAGALLSLLTACSEGPASDLLGANERPRLDYQTIKLLPVRKIHGSFTARQMPVQLFPLRKDYFYQYQEDSKTGDPATIKTVTLDGVRFDFHNLYISTEASGKVEIYTLLPHTTGSRNVPVALFESGHYIKTAVPGYSNQVITQYVVDHKYYKDETILGKDVIGETHSVVAEFYPNKVINILETLQAIDEWQQENGGFKEGEEYSLLSILQIMQRPGYVKGKTSSGSIVTAGGACVTATNFAKLQTMIGATVLERWEHPTGSKYWTGPLAGEALRQSNTDTTIEITTSGKKYDFRWIAPRSGYIKIEASLIANGIEAKNPLGDIADAMVVYSMSHVGANPSSQGDTQSSRIGALRKRYEDFRLGKTSLSPEVVLKTEWEPNDQASAFLKSIFPEERLTDFLDEISGNGFEGTVAEVAALVDQFAPAPSTTGIGTLLNGSTWYADQIALLPPAKADFFNSTLRQLDRLTWLVEGQPLQCVGFAMLVGAMHSPYPFPNIGGLPIAAAAQLIPKKIKTGASDFEHVSGRIFAKTIKELDDIEPGDLFVTFESPVGHVGAVIAKKMVDGKPVLLLADSNRKLDGMIKLYQLDGYNFEAIFPHPYRKVILRVY